MKKQLIFLLTAVSLLALAQSPQRFPGGVIGKYFQKTGSSADSVLLGNGQAKAIKDIKTDTLSLSHRIDTKEPEITSGTTSQYWRGDKTFQTLDKSAVGLSNVDNTSDVNKPISTATQTALNGKQPAGTYIVPADTAIFVRKNGDQTITGKKTFLNGHNLYNGRIMVYNTNEFRFAQGGGGNIYINEGGGTSPFDYFLFDGMGANYANLHLKSISIQNKYNSGYPDQVINSAAVNRWNSFSAGTYITPSDTSVFVRKSGTQTITGQKTFSGGLIANGIESSMGGIFYGQAGSFPVGRGTYVANTVGAYGARVLAYDGTAYQDLKLGKLISGSNFQLHLNADGTSIFNGSLTATNLSGTNTGDETLSSIKSKLGAASSVNDGYLAYGDWNIFNNKQNALGFTPENSANKGAANGYVPLDASSKIATTYLPDAILGSVKYKGTLNASGGSYPSSPSKGDYYVVSTPGTIGSVTYTNGDWAVYNGTTWDAILQGHYVTSVFGRTGAITANSGDYNTSQVAESGNLYYTDARAQAANASALSNKVDKVSGKGLSTVDFTDASYVHTDNNYTTTEKNKLAGIAAALSTTTVGLTTTSGTANGVSSLTVNAASGYAIPTTTQLNNAATAYSWGNHASAGYATQSWVGSNCQPLENQRLSTGNSPSFPTATLSSGLLSLSGTRYPQIRFVSDGDPKDRILFNDATNKLIWRYDGSTDAYILDSHNFGSYATPLNGAGANGTWGINISGTAASATTWNNQLYESPIGNSGSIDLLMGHNSDNNKWTYYDSSHIKSWLGLGSNAYTSTAYLPLSGGVMGATASIYFGDNNHGITMNGTANHLDLKEYSGDFRFINTQTSSEIARFQSNTGYLGIGTTSPAYALDVAGTARCTSTIISGGSPSAGKVLTATDASGNCTWQTPPSGTSGTYISAITAQNCTISSATARYIRIGNVVEVNIGGNMNYPTANLDALISVSLPFGVSDGYSESGVGSFTFTSVQNFVDYSTMSIVGGNCTMNLAYKHTSNTNGVFNVKIMYQTNQ
jgi:hypothetical protein